MKFRNKSYPAFLFPFSIYSKFYKPKKKKKKKKKKKVQIKNSNMFHIPAQNIVCVCTRSNCLIVAVRTSTHNEQN